jgi:NAD(P)-dependent dehydrogenase (short-subunit alcohol dehydrogenase family)
VPIQLDLAEGETAVHTATFEVLSWLGTSKLVILVNNAGNSYNDWDKLSWEDSRAVNYKGPCLLTEALSSAFAANGASVTMVGSGLGDISLLSPKYQSLLGKARSITDLDEIAGRSVRQLGVEHSWVGPYGMSKALLHRATEIFAVDRRFSSRGVLVNAVCPGWVSSDMGGEQAPISVDEGAGHVLHKALDSQSDSQSAATGTFKCYCYKNYDEEHNRAWEAKHGKW